MLTIFSSHDQIASLFTSRSKTYGEWKTSCITKRMVETPKIMAFCHILPTYQLVQDFATIHSSRLFTTTTQNSSEFLVSKTLKTSKNPSLKLGGVGFPNGFTTQKW